MFPKKAYAGDGRVTHIVQNWRLLHFSVTYSNIGSEI